ncbi:F-type conjugal transfer protein TrbF [Escherichia coli]|uniref:F-type conjugal transfer protein TrbF n=1 Tax=Escherichia coli TaxID=562 RepID=UPI0029E7D8A7|nr:F-type conjugal transfer protein TrbF [Escherichia coli]MDX7975817.1 F-type conjugal transfer protein TrbF [Escherichia coli]
MKENKKNQGFRIRKTRRDIECSCDNAEKYFLLFVVFFVAGLPLWHGMHAIFSAGTYSWKADPELNDLIYMWNILMYAIPYTLYALAAGFLVTFFLSPMYELIFGNIMIFLLKRRMRRENTLREGSNNASH